MRKINLTFVALMLLFTGSVFGQNSDKRNQGKELEYQIGEILDGYYKRPDRDMIAKILFTVNIEHEIVVLDVETENRDFEEFIKNKLNYKEVKSDAILREGDKFVVQVRLLS